MATPAEIVARWDARRKREAAIAKAKKAYANDNVEMPAAGEILVDGAPMKFWLPPGATIYQPEMTTSVALRRAK